MPRSGSELLQALLAQHPAIAASATSPLLEYVFGAAKNLETPEAKSQPDSQKYFDAFGGGGMREYAKHALSSKEGASLYVDKSRGWVYYYPLISKVLGEEPKVVCMVRDLAEIVASMENLHRNSANVLGDPLQNVTTGERIDHWLKTTPVGLALRRVMNALDQGYKGVLYVRYEDLCAAPQKVLDGIVEHLGLPQHDFDLENIEKAASEDERAFWSAEGIHKVEAKMEPAHTRANELFGEVVADRIRQFGAAYQNFFGYPLPENKGD